MPAIPRVVTVREPRMVPALNLGQSVLPCHVQGDTAAASWEDLNKLSGGMGRSDFFAFVRNLRDAATPIL